MISEGERVKEKGRNKNCKHANKITFSLSCLVFYSGNTRNNRASLQRKEPLTVALKSCSFLTMVGTYLNTASINTLNSSKMASILFSLVSLIFPCFVSSCNASSVHLAARASSSPTHFNPLRHGYLPRTPPRIPRCRCYIRLHCCRWWHRWRDHRSPSRRAEVSSGLDRSWGYLRGSVFDCNHSRGG